MGENSELDRLLFELLSYTPENLRALLDGTYLAKYDSDYPQAVPSRRRLQYLEGYLGNTGINAQTIIIEPSYIDGDYLEDYAGHYSRCFRPYWRKCTRLHFFSRSFDEAVFRQFLLGTLEKNEDEELRASYLGFIVRRPLPRTVIGRTCLACYPKEKGRSYPTVRPYEVHLFGQTLTVDSVAFQEQDKTVSACATSAMWSAFHVTGKRFQHPIFSPSEITRIANERHPLESRGIPSGGLNIQQLAACLRSVGLEPYAVDVDKPRMPEEQRERRTRETIYAYSHLGLPVLVGFSLVKMKSGETVGRHVATVLGYKLQHDWLPPDEPQLPLSSRLCARAMQKLFVHDDQVGPFARMEFDGQVIPTERDRFSLSTDWGSEAHRAVPTQILVPLYHKIRIPYERILQAVDEFDQHFSTSQLKELPAWDIFLTSTCEFRENLRSIRNLDPEDVVAALATPYPRFLWQASAAWRGARAFDLLFDATDLAQSDGFVDLIPYDQNAVQALLKLFSKVSPEAGSVTARIKESVLSRYESAAGE